MLGDECEKKLPGEGNKYEAGGAVGKMKEARRRETEASLLSIVKDVFIFIVHSIDSQ